MSTSGAISGSVCQYCDFVNVTSEVETLAGSAEVLWNSNDVTVTVTHGATPTHVQMKFEQNYLDLLTSEMRTESPGLPISGPRTLKIAYNTVTATATHSRVFQNQDPAAGVQIAHLVGKAFDKITDADVVGASWTSSLIDDHSMAFE